MSSLVSWLLILGCWATDRRPVPPAKQVPVLCYHNIRTSLDGHQLDYTVELREFRQQMKLLSDSGFHSITPDQLYQYLTRGAPLPKRPVMFTFDDNRLEQYTMAAPVLQEFGFKGVFFIMTVTIGKPGFMSAAQIRTLSDEGHTIAAHTWDHPDIRKLGPEQWRIQVDQPKQTLEKITGRPVVYFAYPFGAWNDAAIRQLKQRGVVAAFQLAGKSSDTEPLYTIRRILVPGNWTATRLLTAMHASFR